MKTMWASMIRSGHPALFPTMGVSIPIIEIKMGREDRERISRKKPFRNNPASTRLPIASSKTLLFDDPIPRTR